MPEENKMQKQVKLEFASDTGLPILYVNTVNVSFALEEFFLTLGAAVPLEVKDIKDLEGIDTIEARPYFRCAVTRSVMRRIIDLMESVYNQQSQQIEILQQLHEREGEDS
jgi:hypothetical protein